MMPSNAARKTTKHHRRFGSTLKPHYWLAPDGMWRRCSRMEYPVIVMFGPSIRTIRQLIDLEKLPVRYEMRWLNGR